MAKIFKTDNGHEFKYAFSSVYKKSHKTYRCGKCLREFVIRTAGVDTQMMLDHLAQECECRPPANDTVSAHRQLGKTLPIII